MSNRNSSRSGNPAKRAARPGQPPAGKARTTTRARPTSVSSARRKPANQAADGPIRRLQRLLSAALNRLLAAEPRPRPPLLAARTRADVLWALATALVAAAVFSTTVISGPPLADGSEAISGVASLGILHAPGYPSYVLAAKAFTLVEPFGGLALRVSLFSLLCAAASVGLVQLLARRAGASRPMASIGAIVLAVSASYWFYSDYTKHDAFSGLCLIASLYLLLSYESRPSTGRLAGFAVAVGAGLGSSWPLQIMLAPAAVFVLVRCLRAIRWRALVIAVVAGAAVLVGSYGYVLVRAPANPAVNWGLADTPAKVIQLIERSDFTTTSATSTSVASNSSGSSSATGAAQTAPPSHSRQLRAVVNYIVIMWREFGPLGLILAAWGAIASLLWRRSSASWPLAIVFVTNLVGAVVSVGIHTASTTYTDDLIEEGFLLGCYFVIAVWLALALTDVLARATALLARVRPGAARVRPALARAGVPTPAAISVLAVVIVAAVLVPRISDAWAVAHRSDNGYGNAFASTALSELPPHAALFVAGSDLTFPLTYRQVVLHRRPDVGVVAIGGLRYGWYRTEMSRELGVRLPPYAGTALTDFERVVRLVAQTRPVYVDGQAADALPASFRVRSVGLVDGVLGDRTQPALSPSELESRLLAAERAAGMPSANWNAWPNAYLNLVEYVDLGLRAAGGFYAARDYPAMRAALENVLRINPGNSSATQDIGLLDAQHPGA